MKVTIKAPFFNALGLFKKGDVIDVEEKDFDATLMDPTEETEAEAKKEPAKKTAGRKKKEA